MKTHKIVSALHANQIEINRAIMQLRKLVDEETFEVIKTNDEVSSTVDNVCNILSNLIDN